MAGTLPTDPSLQEANNGDTAKKSRKQWSIQGQGGARGLLRRMRSQLAEDGCPESQLVMGKTLLEQVTQGQGDGEEEEEEGARLAVFWLTRASLQGNAEATHLLHHCLTNDIGICEHNYHEVQECLSMDLQEKLARQAAHMLFTSLSDGNDYISSSSLTLRLKEGPHTTNAPPSTDSGWSRKQRDLEEKYGGERLRQDQVVSAALHYCQGRLPPLLTRPLRWPLAGLERLRQAGGTLLTVAMTELCWMLRAVARLATLALLATLAWLAAGAWVAVVASVAGLISMVLATLGLLAHSNSLVQFEAWSGLLAHHCPDLDVARAEAKFRSQCWGCYGWLVGGLLALLASAPFLPTTLWPLYLPLFSAFALLTFFFLPEKWNGWQLVSVVVYMGAVTPPLTTSLLSLAQDTPLGPLLTDSQIDLYWGMTLHIGVGPVVQVVWWGAHAGVALFCGVRHLPPHLVALAWCHLTLLSCHHFTTAPDLLGPLLGWGLVVAVVGIFLWWGPRGLVLTQGGMVFGLLVVLGIMIALVQPLHPQPVTPSALEWSSYHRVCVPGRDPESLTVVGCGPLQGSLVQWRGTVVSLRVAQVHNLPRALLALLPPSLSHPLSCLLGPDKCGGPWGVGGIGEDERCRLVRDVLGARCSLRGWDQVSYEVALSMAPSYAPSYFSGSPEDLVLQVDPSLGPSVRGLRAGDKVEFVARLAGGLGTARPRLHLSSVTCLACVAPISSLPSTIHTPTYHTPIHRFIFNFFLGPALTV